MELLVIQRITLILIFADQNIFFPETAIILKGKLWKQFLLNDEDNHFKKSITENCRFNILKIKEEQ